MNAHTIVIFKEPRTDKASTINVERYAQGTETVTSIDIISDVYPATPVPLQITVQSPSTLLLQKGQNGVTYGIDLEVTYSSGRTITLLVAVTVALETLFPKNHHEPTSFADLVDTIEAGSAAVATATFIYPPTVIPNGGFVEWRLLNKDGEVQSLGTAINYRINSTGTANVARATCIINVPSDLSPSNHGEKYQLQYVLYLDGKEAQVVAENVTVIGLTSTPLGTANLVEVKGNTAVLSLVTDRLYEYVNVELQANNETISPATRITDFERTDSGYMWGASLATDQLAVSLEPYNVLWSYYNGNQSAYYETASLFIVNTSIIGAINDVLARINKARTTLYGMPDMLFPHDTVMLWLRRGADYFNGYGGEFTQFTFINAKGIIREFWLQCAEMFALESQELAEAEKAFNYSGANISLDVDRTAGYSAAADKIRSRLDNELRSIKKNLIARGNDQGDGSVSPTGLNRGAIGSVGVTISPATSWGRYPGTFIRQR